MKKRLLLLLGSGCLVLVLAALPFMAACAEPEPESIELVFATSISEGGGGAMIKLGLDHVEEESEGRVTITRYWSSSLIEEKETYPAVVEGIVDMTVVYPALFAGQFPLSDVMSLLPAFGSAEEGLPNWVFVRDYLLNQKEWADVKVLHIVADASQGLATTNKLVQYPDDVGGLNIAARGFSAEYIKAAGGIPIQIPPSEMYQGLQSGLLDGSTQPDVVMQSLKIAEVVKYYYRGFSPLDVNMIVMNLDTYNSLPADIQKLFDDLGSIEWQTSIAKQLDQKSESALEYVRSLGVEVIDPSPEMQAAWLELGMPMHDDWAQELEDKGLPAKKLLEDRYEFLKQYFPPEIFEIE